MEEGQEIAAGDVLAEIETDKATMDWESQVPLPNAWNLQCFRMSSCHDLACTTLLCGTEGGAMHGLQDDGYVAKILMPAGSKDIKVNTVVGIIVEEKDDVGAVQYTASSCSPAHA